MRSLLLRLLLLLLLLLLLCLLLAGCGSSALGIATEPSQASAPQQNGFSETQLRDGTRVILGRHVAVTFLESAGATQTLHDDSGEIGRDIIPLVVEESADFAFRVEPFPELDTLTLVDPAGNRRSLALDGSTDNVSLEAGKYELELTSKSFSTNRDHLPVVLGPDGLESSVGIDQMTIKMILLLGGKPGLDLRGIDLRGLDVRGIERVTDLSQANLQGVDLSDAYLNGAILDGASVVSANLSGSSLRNVSAIDTNFSRANLARIDWNSAILSGARFDHAEMMQSDFSEAEMDGVRLFSSNLSGSLFSNTFLTQAELGRASLEGSYLDGCDFRGADLFGANLRCVNLQNSVFTNATLPAGTLALCDSGGNTGLPNAPQPGSAACACAPNSPGDVGLPAK